MTQHPKVTIEWALQCLEQAIRALSEGPAESRVRRQFHQLLLAVERDTLPIEVQRLRLKIDDPPPDQAA